VLLGKNWRKHMAETHRKHIFHDAAPKVGHQAPTSRELTLGATLLAPDAQTGTSSCVVPRSSAWGPTCRGPMHLFKCVVLLFSIISQLKLNLLALTLDFLIDKKLELRRNRFLEIIEKCTFFWTKVITWLVYNSNGLRWSM